MVTTRTRKYTLKNHYSWTVTYSVNYVHDQAHYKEKSNIHLLSHGYFSLQKTVNK